MNVPPELDERYPFVSLLGQGGFGIVYLAEQPGLARQVVVKVLTDLTDDSQARFEREARLLARVEHPGVTRVVDHGDLGDVQFLVTLYEPGETLRALVEDRGALPWREAAELMRGIAQALEAVHARGIVHRDLSGGNVLITERGPLLLDFGLAVTPAGTRMTEAGTVMGTPRYLSPEAMSGHEATAASDLFACGVLLHELLAGRIRWCERCSRRLRRWRRRIGAARSGRSARRSARWRSSGCTRRCAGRRSRTVSPRWSRRSA